MPDRAELPRRIVRHPASLSSVGMYRRGLTKQTDQLRCRLSRNDSVCIEHLSTLIAQHVHVALFSMRMPRQMTRCWNLRPYGETCCHTKGRKFDSGQLQLLTGTYDFYWRVTCLRVLHDLCKVDISMGRRTASLHCAVVMTFSLADAADRSTCCTGQASTVLPRFDW